MKTTKLFLAMAMASFVFFTACEDGVFNKEDDANKEFDQELFVNGNWGDGEIDKVTFSHLLSDKSIQFRAIRMYEHNGTELEEDMFIRIPKSLLLIEDTMYLNDDWLLSIVTTPLWDEHHTSVVLDLTSAWVYLSDYGDAGDDARSSTARDAVGSFEAQYLDSNTNVITTISADFHLRDYTGNWL